MFPCFLQVRCVEPIILGFALAALLVCLLWAASKAVFGRCHQASSTKQTFIQSLPLLHNPQQHSTMCFHRRHSSSTHRRLLLKTTRTLNASWLFTPVCLEALHCVICCAGLFSARETGNFTFGISSSGKFQLLFMSLIDTMSGVSRLWIDQELLLSTDNHQETNSTVFLSAGFHKITIAYFHNGGRWLFSSYFQSPAMFSPRDLDSNVLFSGVCQDPCVCIWFKRLFYPCSCQ